MVAGGPEEIVLEEKPEYGSLSALDPAVSGAGEHTSKQGWGECRRSCWELLVREGLADL